MATSSAQIRAYRGPAIFSYGFRPFFLFGACWAAIAVALWLPMLSGAVQLPIAWSPIEWHVHEMLFGYVPAVIAGFLLTAVPNWTGRLPVVGAMLQLLFATWVAGRLAVLTAKIIGFSAVALIDLSFMTLLGAMIAREIVAGHNWRNLKVLIVLGLLLLGNVLFHLEGMDFFRGGYGARLGVAATVTMIMLIGGRIIPSFTRNWLARRGESALPVQPGSVDWATMGVSGLALVGWLIKPDAFMTSMLALIAAAFNVVRLSRWAGARTVAEPLVLVLHIGYAFVPAGFFLLALSIMAPGLVASSGALHGWTIGAIGTMTLAVMTRASLGHTGQPLKATPAIALIYAAIVLSALSRLVAAFSIAREPMLYVSAFAWVSAFAGFVVVYTPLLLRRQ